MQKLWQIAVVSLAAGIALPAMAQKAEAPIKAELTRAQVEARALARFTAMDTDGNGTITAAERNTARAARMVKRGADVGAKRVDGAGRDITVTDAVKRVMARYDARDANKDGRIGPDERRGKPVS